METNSKKMDFQWGDVEKHLPGIFGSIAYFFYMRVYQNVSLNKSLVALFTGCLFASFLGSQVSAWFPSIKGETVGFLVGALGMKVMEGLAALDVKGMLKKTVEKPLK